MPTDTCSKPRQEADAARSLADAREEAVSQREQRVQAREAAVQIREHLVSLPGSEMHPRSQEVRSTSENEAVRMDRLCEANENLVIAAVHSREAAEAAERANRQQEQFVALLAHELRNPLAPIVNALAVLQQVRTSEQSVNWAYDIIKRQVDHMTRLLNDLLDISRLKTGKVVLQKAPVAVKDVMLEAVEMVDPLVRNRSQHLQVELPDGESLVVDGDAVRLVQVFSNLLGNAVKYTGKGGHIRFSAARQANDVVLRVADDGCGITPEALPGIFRLFAQEGRSLADADGGLGIGLSIVRGMVEMHGGSVTADSRGAGEGAEFLVTLPLARSEAMGPDFRAGTRPGPVAIHGRVVIIEDNVDGTDSLRMLLELAGCEVFCALDGAAGVGLVHEKRPQIVLCDIGLPGMNGYDVIARLRKAHPRPMPLMIALTGYGQPEDRARSLAAGFDHHLVKPLDPGTLLRLIADEESRLKQPQGTHHCT